MKNNAPVSIPAEKLHLFEGHPFKALDNEEMNQLTQSIQDMYKQELIRCTAHRSVEKFLR